MRGKLKKNPDWNYEFYDDARILDFFEKEFPPAYLKAYERLTIGAAEADFFRYAVLYKKGGFYLDIDGYLNAPLNSFIRENDTAIISLERNPGLYCQWALIFDKNHPFLEKTLEKVLENIETKRFPNDVHKTTVPTVYSEAIEEVIRKNPKVNYRRMGVDYKRKIKPKYKLAKLLLYGDRSEHWRKKQETQDLIK